MKTCAPCFTIYFQLHFACCESFLASSILPALWTFQCTHFAKATVLQYSIHHLKTLATYTRVLFLISSQMLHFHRLSIYMYTQDTKLYIYICNNPAGLVPKCNRQLAASRPPIYLFLKEIFLCASNNSFIVFRIYAFTAFFSVCI